MYYKKNKILPLTLVLIGVLVGATVLFLVVKNSPNRAKKHSKLTQSNFNTSLPGDSALKIANKLSYPKNQATMTGEMNQELSDLSKRVQILEFTITKLKQGQRAMMSSGHGRKEIEEYPANTADGLSQTSEETESIQERHQSESIDELWSQSAVQTFHHTIKYSPIDGVELLDVDCRSTMCRADFALDDQSLDVDALALQESIPWDSDMVIQIEDVHSGEFVVFLAREGYSIPTQSK